MRKGFEDIEDMKDDVKTIGEAVEKIDLEEAVKNKNTIESQESPGKVPKFKFVDKGGESTELTDMGSPLSGFLMKKKRAKEQTSNKAAEFSLGNSHEMQQCDLGMSPQI